MSIEQIVFAVLAVLISISALCTTIVIWKQTYRPIVTAQIVTKHSTQNGFAYSIHVYNTGTRPAVDIRLSASVTEIQKIIVETISAPMLNELAAVFSDHGLIPILHPGTNVCNGFGHNSVNRQSAALIYNSILPIIITYKDLFGRSFIVKQRLFIKDSTWFAGSGWGD